jgi:phosphate transport system substrate-binding protein
MTSFLRGFALSCTVLALAPLAAAQAAVRINGAGATFPYPLYSKWFSDYAKVRPEAQINYQSIGSGGGIRQLLDQTVDFGASDAPMTDEQLGKAKSPVLHVPTVLGAVALTYHVPGVTGSLKLSAEAVADLFLGKITKWNDPKIAADNPGVALPATPVMIAHRSDGSGTTAVFVDYLAKVSPEWKQKVGVGTSVKWPTGLGGKGNEGVTGLVKQTPGALGYVELIYAETNKLPVAELKNVAGAWVKPSVEGASAAAAATAKAMPADFRLSITNAAGKGAYPISAFTYLLVYQNMAGEKGVELKRFLDWAMGDGQRAAAALHYAPLPKELLPKVKAQIAKIQAN